MNTLTLTNTHENLGAMSQPARKPHLATTQTLGAGVGLVGGTTAALLGALLIAASWFAGNEAVGHWLSTAGSVLLCLTIPLIIMAACCLDCIEKEKPRGRSKAARYKDDYDEQ